MFKKEVFTMKKALILTAYILFAAAFSGCGNSAENTVTSTETTVTFTETETTLTSTETETNATSTETETTVTSTETETSAETISDHRITREEAKAAAIAYSGLYETEIWNPGTTFYYDGELPVIEVSFGTPYNYTLEYKVNATNGSIIDFTEYPYCAELEEVISPEEAEAIALEHAGFTADEVNFTETERLIDNIRDAYSVKFTGGGREYEYYIHATDGFIIKSD